MTMTINNIASLLMNPYHDNRYDPFVDQEFNFISDLIQHNEHNQDYYIEYNGIEYFNLILCGFLYGGAVVNRIANMIKRKHGNLTGMAEFCKTNIQVYTFGMI